MDFLELTLVLIGGALLAAAGFIVHPALGCAAAGAFLLWLGYDWKGGR